LAQESKSSPQLNAQLNINLSQVKVPEIAQKVIQSINEVELTGDFSASAKKFGIPEINQSAIQNRIDQQKKAHDYLASIGEVYKNLKSQFKIQNLNISGTTASLDVEEYTEIGLSKPEDVAAGIVPKYIKNHRFTFTISGGQIKLASHKLLNDPDEPSPESIKNAVPAPPDAVPATISLHNTKFADTLVASSRLNQLSLQSIPLTKWPPSQRLKSKAFGLFPLIIRNFISTRITTYDRAKAVEYAGKYWNSFNPKYRNFEQVLGVINQGDCTNYASQVLYEGGGWTFINGMVQADDTTWWYNPDPAIPVSRWGDSQSNSWSAAPNLFAFFKNHPERAKPVNQSSLLRPGDIVQVDLNHGEGLSHTMVVTLRKDNGTIFLAAHTKPHYMIPIYDIQANNPGAKFFTWQMQNEFVDPNGLINR
jgi:Putative amidase domain